MTKTVRARFDGKTFVPVEPVDLPAGREVDVVVRGEPDPPPPEASGDRPLAALAEWARSLPPLEDNPLPTDFAAQHDHYLYGTPKRP